MTATPPPEPTSLTALRARELRAPRYTSYPTALQLKDSFSPALFERELAASNDDLVPSPLALYVHLPYCAAACFYCGCHRVISRKAQTHNAYLEHLLKEIAQTVERIDTDRLVQQIHMGGGTPNLLRPVQLERLLEGLTAKFALQPGCEVAMEVDPRQARPGDAHAWASLGFNRLSLGVQDIDPDVQKAINRVQPASDVARLVKEIRRAGIQGLNMDLVLGLPRQTRRTVAQSLDWVIDQQPSRIALYQYAHMPLRFPAQRAINDDELPSLEQRFAFQDLARDRLQIAGYVDIGLDHYARPDDDLARAFHDGRLRRNFQGYTVLADSELFGFGVSAISCVGRCIVQNLKDTPAYAERVEAGRSPLQRGMLRSREDLRRARLIERLMCRLEVDTQAFGADEGLDFAAHFADAIDRLNRLDPRQEFLNRRQAVWKVTTSGRQFLRLLASCFDEYQHLGQTAERTSVTSRMRPETPA
jgi:oxygen-independent coproporphyrinogen-3 oxidase